MSTTSPSKQVSLTTIRDLLALGYSVPGVAGKLGLSLEIVAVATRELTRLGLVFELGKCGGCDSCTPFKACGLLG